MMLDDVTDDTFSDRVIAASHGRAVLVEFWAEWCPPCRALTPILEQLADERAESLTVVRVEADDNPRTATEYRALALPTMKLFLDGEVVRTIVGAKPKAALEAELTEGVRGSTRTP